MGKYRHMWRRQGLARPAGPRTLQRSAISRGHIACHLPLPLPADSAAGHCYCRLGKSHQRKLNLPASGINRLAASRIMSYYQGLTTKFPYIRSDR